MEYIIKPFAFCIELYFFALLGAGSFSRDTTGGLFGGLSAASYQERRVHSGLSLSVLERVRNDFCCDFVACRPYWQPRPQATKRGATTTAPLVIIDH